MSNTAVTHDVLNRAKKIKIMIFDVDGIMTDGGLTIGDDGQEYKTFHSQDGLGMKLLKESGVAMAIITGRSSNVVTRRANSLGIEHLYQGVDDKLAAFNALLEQLDIAADESAFMGDDFIDLPPMLRSGMAFTVPAAPDQLKQHAHYVTTKEGGRGAVREVCELILQAQGNWETMIAPFLD